METPDPLVHRESRRGSSPGEDLTVYSEGRVCLFRGDAVESTHVFHAVVSDGERVLARVGRHDRLTFYRSASKPFQALPLVEDGVLERFDLGHEELALCCASHNSQEEHVRVARRILDRIGLDESMLECGGHWPLRPSEGLRLVDQGRRPGAVESNCSGKHAGMLALAVHHGWDPRGYRGPDHPVQKRMAAEVARWSGTSVSDLVTGVDGCGVMCFAVPLRSIADAFARFGRSAARGEGAAVVAEAMVTHPEMVAGRKRLCTDLMRAEPGIVAKIGAEGVYGACHPELGQGVALKVEDGSMRAAEPALVAVLERLGWLDAPSLAALERYRTPVVNNTRGERVGRIEVSLELWAS